VAVPVEVVVVDVRLGGAYFSSSASSFTFLPRAVRQAAEPVLSTFSLKFFLASSRPQRLSGMFHEIPVRYPSMQ